MRLGKGRGREDRAGRPNHIPDSCIKLEKGASPERGCMKSVNQMDLVQMPALQLYVYDLGHIPSPLRDLCDSEPL